MASNTSCGKEAYKWKFWRRIHWELCERKVNKSNLENFVYRPFANISHEVVRAFVAASQLPLCVANIYWCKFHRASSKNPLWMFLTAFQRRKAQDRHPYSISILSIRHISVHGDTVPSWPRFPKCQGFTLRKTTLVKNSLHEWTRQRREFYLPKVHI
jgi:hypothetical protein